ncbi:hypothetical protein O1L60_45040 [Streptomyces diastatochromogenes]|nr:hypothetical protein [Streptomyces diastatochromogenes]
MPWGATRRSRKAAISSTGTSPVKVADQVRGFAGTAISSSPGATAKVTASTFHRTSVLA